MTRGIIYYNKGSKCIIRLCVSVWSLRLHYDGPVTVIIEGGSPEWLTEYLTDEMDCFVLPVADSGEPCLARKAQLWRCSPYDLTMFIDADTIIRRPVDEFFSFIDQHGFVVYNFCGWKTTGKKISGRIREWKKCCSDTEIDMALKYGDAVNTGVFGFRKNNPILPAWEKLARQGVEHGCTRIMVDELACQLLLPRYRHKMAGQEWGASVRYGDIDNAKIIHYHGQKHVFDSPACDIWKQHYWDMRHRAASSKHMVKAYRDKRLSRYMNESRRDDLTIVTAVNPAYIDKFRVNWELWTRMKGIREQQFIVFVNRISPNDRRLEFINRSGSVRIVRWKFPAAGDNVRERMISAFVYGAAEYVTTRYWMKLDGDATPKTDEFIYPEYDKYTLTAHKWGYTRVKGDPGAARHWLNTLDDWYGNGRMFPDDLPVRARHGHPRIASFCAIEKTTHTRRLAEKAGHRLPVPSQDTCSWYMAAADKEPILRVNMKRYFAP